MGRPTRRRRPGRRRPKQLRIRVTPLGRYGPWKLAGGRALALPWRYLSAFARHSRPGMIMSQGSLRAGFAYCNCLHMVVGSLTLSARARITWYVACIPTGGVLPSSHGRLSVVSRSAVFSCWSTATSKQGNGKIAWSWPATRTSGTPLSDPVSAPNCPTERLVGSRHICCVAGERGPSNSRPPLRLWDPHPAKNCQDELQGLTRVRGNRSP